MSDSTSARNAMTKADLINIVAKKLDITQVQSGIIVEAALRSIVNALQGGQEVEIRGFGSFRFRNRAPRKGRNPKTGEKVDVPPKKIPYFKMGKELKALLNGQPPSEEPASASAGPTSEPSES
ncbi:MAG TPA: HU family DNA-binding protein [Vicinamibacteria bacterium]|nr:HU family DNA-binding protein [Vicinamibacteria bacterium]